MTVAYLCTGWFDCSIFTPILVHFLISMPESGEKLWEEFVLEVLFGLNFCSQPTTGQGVRKERHLKKTDSIISEFLVCRLFCL